MYADLLGECKNGEDVTCDIQSALRGAGNSGDEMLGKINSKMPMNAEIRQALAERISCQC